MLELLRQQLQQFLSRVSTLTRDIDIEILSVRHVAVFYMETV